MSRKSFGEPVKKADSATTVQAFKRRVSGQFGFPLVVYHDNGSHFRGDFADFMAQSGVKHIFSPPYSPPSNGLAEVVVGLFKFGLQKGLQADYTSVRDWHFMVAIIERDLNQRVIKMMGFVPDELFFGFIPRFDRVPLHIEDVLRAETYRLSLSHDAGDNSLS